MKVFCAVLFFSVVVVTHAVMYKDCGKIHDCTGASC